MFDQAAKERIRARHWRGGIDVEEQPKCVDRIGLAGIEIVRAVVGAISLVRHLVGLRCEHLDSERGPRVLAALDEIAAAHEAPVATVALAWLAARPTVAAPIASARTVDQLPALLGVAELVLTDAEVDRLTQASA